MSALLANTVLRASVLAWIAAQVLKFLLVLLVQRRVDVARLVGTGGMPSSHTAFVSALVTATGRTVGWESPLFAVSLVFASIVVYDATGVRQAVGQHAEVLNKILEDLYRGRTIPPARLRELLGHSPLEALAGVALGVLAALATT
ncbi:MAG: divergent PAP2 family protein [Bacillota bacterium]